MVDALIRATGWLAPGGVVIDLRPAEVVPDIALALPDGAVLSLGQPVVGQGRRVRHRNADAAVREVVERHVFRVEDDQRFSFFYHADSAVELRDYLAANWRETRVDDSTVADIVRAMRAHPDGRLRLHERAGIRTLIIE